MDGWNGREINNSPQSTSSDPISAQSEREKEKRDPRPRFFAEVVWPLRGSVGTSVSSHEHSRYQIYKLTSRCLVVHLGLTDLLPTIHHGLCQIYKLTARRLVPRLRLGDLLTRRAAPVWSYEWTLNFLSLIWLIQHLFSDAYEKCR